MMLLFKSDFKPNSSKINCKNEIANTMNTFS